MKKAPVCFAANVISGIASNLKNGIGIKARQILKPNTQLA